MNRVAPFAALAAALLVQNACSSTPPPVESAASGSNAGGASGSSGNPGGTGSGASASGAGTGTGSGQGGSGETSPSSGQGGSGDSQSSGATSGLSASGASGSSAGSGATSGEGGSGDADASADDAAASGSSFDGALPPGAVHDIPTGYGGMPFKGVKLIPGTIYARDYDTGGPGVGYNHPGGITCGDWPANTPLYRTDCVGLSETNAQKPDVTPSGGPAVYGEVYVSYCSTGEWLNYTVEVEESGTYSISMDVAAPANLTVSFGFLAPATAASGTLAVPESVDQAMPTHEMYHVWQVTGSLGQVTLQAGIYVMQFKIVSSQGNFDTFVFTKM